LPHPTPRFIDPGRAYGYQDAAARETALRVRFSDLTQNRVTRYLYGPGRTFAYNQRDQQTSVTIAGVGAYSVSFLGAGQAERYDANGIKLQFNALGLGVRDNGPADTSYFTRTETGRLLSHRFSAGRSYYLTDAVGSVTGLVDASGALVRSVRYDPAGQVLSTSGSATSLQGFAGGYKLAGDLVHFGQRYYDPTTGRWTQTDPLDQTGDLKQGNRYVYAAGDSVNRTDQRGTFSVGLDAEVQLGPVRFSAGVSIDDDGNVGVSGGGGGGSGVGGGIKGTVNPFGKVRNGGEVEGGGCVGPGLAACYSASSRGGGSAGIGGGAEAGIAYRQTRRVANLW
jgi:RHS repeat-associated protein